MSAKTQEARAKISLDLETSAWIKDLQKRHKIRLSLSQIVGRACALARTALTAELTPKAK